MLACCDIHDYCYDSCGTSRSQCDEDFSRCLHATCAAENLPTKDNDDCSNTAGKKTNGDYEETSFLII